VANKESTFYSSTVFGKILDYVQQHKRGVHLRETEKFLVLHLEDVKSMKAAQEKLKGLKDFVPASKENSKT